MNVTEWTPVITAIIGFMSLAVSGYIGLKMAQVKANTQEAVGVAKEAAIKVEQVAVKAEENAAIVAATSQESSKQMAEIARVGVDTHTLVNNNMGVQLKLGADLSEFKAATTGLAEDIAAAKLARGLYEEHVRKQALVDSGVRQPAAVWEKEKEKEKE